MKETSNQSRPILLESGLALTSLGTAGDALITHLDLKNGTKAIKDSKGKPVKKRDIRFVIEGQGYEPESVMKAPVSTLSTLDVKNKKTEDLIGILSRDSLYDPKYKTTNLKNYTSGKVLNDLHTSATDIEDQ